MSQVSGELRDGKGMGKLTYTSADWYEQRKSWLAQGAYQEKERIIKLLEDLDCEKNGNPNHDTHDCLYYQTADSLIALIKGEK